MSVRVVVGQLQELTEETATFARQMGIGGIQFNTLFMTGEKGYWDVDDIVTMRKSCEDAGFVLEAIENLPYGFYDKVLTGQAGREEQLENVCRSLRALAAAEIPILGYHFLPTSVWRTSMVPGRGGSEVSAFNLEEARRSGPAQYFSPIDPTLEIDEEAMWENYGYFCSAVFPVAEEIGLKMALHPDDPPVADLDGVARLFCSPEAFEKAWTIAGNSPAWGIDLCLGTVSEMQNGAAAVRSMIDTFAPLGRIFYVHFRDVQGSVPRFQECFIGEGNYDAAEVMSLLVQHGFDGFVMDDHVPIVSGDSPGQFRSHAYALGYLQALVAAFAH